MQITPSVPIPIFYWKEDPDAYLAARGILSFMGKNPASLVPLSEGDEVIGLDGKYLIFVGVQFNKLVTMPDAGGAMNCIVIGRYAQLDVVLEDINKLPTQARMSKEAKKTHQRNPLRWRIVSCDWQALTRMAYVSFSNQQRAAEVMPSFIKDFIAIVENKQPTERDELFLKGLSKEPSLLKDDYIGFSQCYIKPWDHAKETLVNVLVQKGREALGDEEKMIRSLIERTTSKVEFCGHLVKIIHLPEEMADKAGHLMARNMPFAVVYEDMLAENKRNYWLYSLQGGLNVMDVAKQYKPKGNARKASFSVAIDFTNHRWI